MSRYFRVWYELTVENVVRPYGTTRHQLYGLS
jgi:hypothetical protein